MIMLAAAFLLGGTTGPIPGRSMIIGLIGCTVFAVSMIGWSGPRPPWALLLALALVILLPLAQLLPLPPSIWSGFGGRDLATGIDALIGEARWRPLSLNPNATVRALLGLTPALAMLLLAVQLDREGQRRLLTLYCGLAVISVMLGMAQLASGDTRFHLFEGALGNLPTGLFSNRNHQAIFLVTGAVCAFVLLVDQARDRTILRLIFASAIALCGAGILATGSRTGIALFVLAGAVAPFMVMRRLPVGRRLFLLILGLAICVVALLLSDVAMRSFGRFGAIGDEGRFQLWPEIWFTIQHYGPLGSGTGTFVQSFQAIEQLELVDSRFINRSHNDYLEVLVESGLAGAAVIGIGLAVTISRAARTIVGDWDQSLFTRAAVIAVGALVLHSVVDYPLRSPAMLTALAMFIGILFNPGALNTQPVPAAKALPLATADRQTGIGHWIASAAVIAGCIALSLGIVATNLSDLALQRNDPGRAFRLWPGSAEAAAALSERLLEQRATDAALVAGVTALRNDTQNSRALRAVARAAQAGGDEQAANAAWLLAAQTGWRDGATQRWVLDQAMARRDYLAASRAADAMLRIRFQPEVALDAMLSMAASPAGRSALADRLSARPRWSGALFGQLDTLAARDPGTAALLLQALDGRGVQPSGTDVMALFHRLLASPRRPAVLASWVQANPRVSGNPETGIVDPQFALLLSGEMPKGPFGWRLSTSDATVTAGAESSRTPSPLLIIRTYAGRRSTLLSQLLALQPGRYALTYTATLPQGDPADFEWELSCGGQRGRRLLRLNLVSAANETQPRRADFTVPTAQCASQALRLRGGSSAQDSNVIELGTVSLAPIR